MLPLNIHHIPISITFSLFDDGKYYLVDPNLVEELYADSQITIIINEHKEICSITMAGGQPVSDEIFMLLAQISAAKASDITQLIKQTITNKPL